VHIAAFNRIKKNQMFDFYGCKKILYHMGIIDDNLILAREIIHIV
jgi:hypothetical protein